MSKSDTTKKNKRNGATKAHKISHEQFFAALRENAGLYSRTARAIEAQFNIKYSRQAVQQRAEKYPEILEDIQQENLDMAEEGLVSVMRSRSESVRLDAIKFFLKTKGKKRGYVEKTETDVNLKMDIPLFPDVPKNHSSK